MPLARDWSGLSIPLIIFGSTLLLKLMERFPVIITWGRLARLGWRDGRDRRLRATTVTHLHELDYTFSPPARCFWQWACGWRDRCRSGRDSAFGAMGVNQFAYRLPDAGESAPFPSRSPRSRPGRRGQPPG